MITGFPSASRLCLRGAIATFFLAMASGMAAAKPSTPSSVPPPSLHAPRYYFTIDLDPRYQIVGTGALTEEAAARANCYCLTYDANGKLQRVEYRRAGQPTPDPLFQAVRIDFEYAPDLERRWYRDAQERPIQNVDDIAGEELALNPAGYPLTVTNLDASGSRTRDSSGVIRYQRKLDTKNRVIRARRTGLLGVDITDANGYFETRTVYDDQGRRIEYGNYDASGNPRNDAEGVALVRTTYTLYPDWLQVTESYFDASGLAVAEKSSGVHQRLRTYDHRGLLVDEAYFDVTGAPTVDNEMQVHEHRYQFDDRGNLLSEEYLDDAGKSTNQKTAGFAKITYQYDEHNRVITKSYFGDDGAPQVLLNLGAAVIRQEYDDQGNLVRRQFFDGQGNPSIHKQYGTEAIRIKVEGDTTIITLRNASDELTENPVGGYAAFSYDTLTDHPLTRKNHYFDRHGRPLSALRVFIINPHLHALHTAPVMLISARYGAGATGVGALLALFIALRKASFTRHRRVYIPTPLERFIGWFGIFAIGEGMIRFFITIWWAYVGYQNGQMGYGVYVFEGVYILFFLYRLWRMRVTMRVLNISRADIHGLLREFFAKAQVEARWMEERQAFITENLDVRLRYFRQKCHAYLSFRARHRAGVELARGLADHLRAQAGSIESLPRTKAIALYYPSVAACYFLLSATAFYTLWQLIKRY
jgi:YD repeat-containing protein